MRRQSCAKCRSALPPSRSRYCSDKCAAESRKRRRHIRKKTAKCRWCSNTYRRTRRGQRFCGSACRQAAHRARRRQYPWAQPQTRHPYWPKVPAPSWIAVYTDAGHRRHGSWGAVRVWRHELNRERRQDNRAVASKLGSGSRAGKSTHIWADLANLTEPLRRNKRLHVCSIRSWDNEADALATPHEHPEVWSVVSTQ